MSVVIGGGVCVSAVLRVGIRYVCCDWWWCVFVCVCSSESRYTVCLL